MEKRLNFNIYEQKLIGIIRKLPSDCILQIIDFARFLEFQLTTHLINHDESEEDIVKENDQWDKLLATDESQKLLEKMADEAMAQINAKNARPMLLTKEGKIKQG
ncbi:DUF2281 domain-containing protein [Candidatus Magnetomoraceae bacterium gMMP-15]